MAYRFRTRSTGTAAPIEPSSRHSLARPGLADNIRPIPRISAKTRGALNSLSAGADTCWYQGGPVDEENKYTRVVPMGPALLGTNNVYADIVGWNTDIVDAYLESPNTNLPCGFTGYQRMQISCNLPPAERGYKNNVITYTIQHGLITDVLTAKRNGFLTYRNN